VRQHFLYFVPSYSMLFPNFLFNEGLNDKLVELQLNTILSATFQENNLRPTSKTMSITSIQSGQRMVWLRGLGTDHTPQSIGLCVWDGKA